MRTLFRAQRRRTLLGMSLMISQAFFYNAVFFTYALVLARSTAFKPSTSVGTWCRLPSATRSARWCSGGCSTASGVGA